MFVAQEGSAVVGLLAASRHWSGIVEIDDLAVSSAARRQGVGRALVEAAKGFVVERGFPGIRVETQSNNVGACMLYARAGFCLAGFDTLLYCSTKGVENEVALFWYWRCP